MSESEFWTSSQREAWPFVLMGMNEGLSQTQALREFRAGGGKIRDAYWGEIWKRGEENQDNWSRLYTLSSGDVVPESMFTRVDIQYSTKYNMTFTTSVRDEEGSIVHSIHRKIGSDRRLTLGQWKAAAAMSMLEDTSILATEVYDITEVEFFERVR